MHEYLNKKAYPSYRNTTSFTFSLEGVILTTNECEPVTVVDSEKSLLERLYPGSDSETMFIEYAVNVPFGGMVFVVQHLISLEYTLIHLNDELAIVKRSTVGLPIELITNLVAIEDGVICTGTRCSGSIELEDEFVIIKFNRNLDIAYYQEYDTLFTSNDPIVTVDRSGVVICSGIKQRMLDGSCVTYLIRFDKDLVMRNSVIYDTTDTINLTSLNVTDDRKIVGVGSIFTDELFMKQTAIVIVFDRNDLQYMYDVKKANTWIDDVNEYTHIKDAALLNDGSLVCVGLTLKGGKKRATVWRFKDLTDKHPIRSIMNDVSMYGDRLTGSSFSRLLSFEDEYACIGSAYNCDGKQQLMFISRFDMQQLDLIESIVLDDLNDDSIINVNSTLIRMSN